MSIDPSIIGRWSEPQVLEVERGAIRRFAEAIGDPNPVHRRGDVAPPTFPTTFGYQLPLPPLPFDPARILHGGEEYTYERPIRAGDRICCVRRITECYERPGSRGTMTFIVFETEGRDPDGNLVYRAKTTWIAI